MLEANPGGRITTASLAKEVGVSEAALYRHFPSKFKMYEGLIDFIEVTVFTRISRILQEEGNCWPRIERILNLVLTFADRNPGITRILTGDALIGENQRLHQRIVQFYNRLETQPGAGARPPLRIVNWPRTFSRTRRSWRSTACSWI